MRYDWSVRRTAVVFDDGTKNIGVGGGFDYAAGGTNPWWGGWVSCRVIALVFVEGFDHSVKRDKSLVGWLGGQ